MRDTPPRRIIDAHNHPDWVGHNLERTLRNMDEACIERAWLLTWEGPQDEYNAESLRGCLVDDGDHGPIGIARCLRYKEQASDRFVVGYAPDPRRPDAIDRLQAAVEIFGVRVCGELKLRMMLDNPDALRLYRFCGENGMPVTVHIDYEFATGRDYPRPNYWYGGGIESFERAIRACPGTIFLGHAPGFWAHISGDDQFDKVAYPKGAVLPGGKLVQMLREYPNLYCDLSAGSALNALSRNLEFSREFLIEFQDRLLFGRDSFDNHLRDLLDSLGLPDGPLDKIYAGNALRLVPDS